MENDLLFCSKLMFTNGKIIVKFINLWYNFIYIFTFVNHTLEIKTTWLIIVSKYI